MSKYKVLSDEQIQSFLDNGYLVVRVEEVPSIAGRNLKCGVSVQQAGR